METETMEQPVKKHIGQNLQRVRVYLGVKQDALASDLNMSQQTISKIEQQEDIEDGLLKQIADALGVSPELIRSFDLERSVYNINHHNYREATISEGATTYAISQQVNPVDKIIELYERLLQSEREKIDILKEGK
ncbi:MAG TPA: helix-turn-helix transcriptional regulator [Niabella sp.]|uniref:helix-turn-helix domain-containing protein n=1 Tax=Agriterribacter sp. TaxID=2821509 RepID=UPI002C7CB315|nr:helix-turn-helix transcriptional regulator [Agriterribacter sp.]HRN46961.1 helix-turn-helix transcriptional regulator [Niabella sp.]HRO46746.1 helix-turn-helix transcriptional regulator [Agriterribacter sp.]HUN03613.1 helix-turn-helix transcriptional regulator [Niabella sp.]